MKTFLILLVTFSIFVSSCSKNSINISDGTYTGTFKVSYDNEIKTGITTIEFKNGKYSCLGSSDRTPAGGSGKYSVTKGKINFEDENFWTAEFDWNLILNGEYDFTFDGENLKISAEKNNVGLYEYILTKD